MDLGSETQLQVGETLNYFIERLKGVLSIHYILVEMMLEVVSRYRNPQSG